jgi:hypothetical protein
LLYPNGGSSEGSREEVAVLHDLLFNGYRLDHRRASKFDATHANYKSSVAAGYYRLAAPATTSISKAFSGSNLPQTSRFGTEYKLRDRAEIMEWKADGNSMEIAGAL